MIKPCDLTPEHLAGAGEILATDGSGWAVQLRRDWHLTPLVGPGHPGVAPRPRLELLVADLTSQTCRAAADLVARVGGFHPASMAL